MSKPDFRPRGLVVGIDGSNIRTGGGLTHMRNVLRVAEPEAHGIARVLLWASRATIDRLPKQPWLELVHEAQLDRSLPWRLAWQRFALPRLVEGHCDVLFAPGGNAPKLKTPIVTMSRNMLPFEMRELRRYGFSTTSLRLLLLRYGQSRTFARAKGIIFLTQYARDAVLHVVATNSQTTIIPHGVDDALRKAPAPQRLLDDCDTERPLRLLYLSIIDTYKHQWHVANAVARLRSKGLPVAIDFVGPAYPSAERRLLRVLDALDPQREYMRLRGAVAPGELADLYASAELFVFASSCENMPNILLEAMASGLPIACSDRGPMPEVLGNGGVYFDPEDPEAIALALEQLARDSTLRARCAEISHARALEFSWPRCASETLRFVASCVGAPNAG